MPVFLFLLLSIIVGITGALHSSWVTAVYAVISSSLAVAAGEGAKFGFRTKDKKQRIGYMVLAPIVLVLSQWLAENFSAQLFGYTIDGQAWCLIGFAIGFLFKTHLSPNISTGPKI